MLTFHLDENVDFAIADGLIRRGISCTRTPPDVPKGVDDTVQLQFCHTSGRVIVTNDQDMLILAAVGTEHSGIAYYYQKSRSIGQLIARLTTLSREHEAEQMKGRVEYL